MRALIEGLICFVALVLWELHIDHPVINFRILKNIPLTIGSSIGIVFGLALFASTFILPQFTQDLLGYDAYQAGLVLAPRAVTLLIFMPVAGWLYKYVDARALVIFGIVIIFWSFYDLSHLALDTGFWNLVPMLLIMGIGMPFMFVTMMTVALSTVPRADMTDASSLYTQHL